MDGIRNTDDMPRVVEGQVIPPSSKTQKPFFKAVAPRFSGSEYEMLKDPDFDRKSRSNCSIFSEIASKNGQNRSGSASYIVPRKICIGQKVTSLRLETDFWDALAIIARDQKCEVVDVLVDIRRVYGTRSFTAQVRKACLGYFRQ